MISVTYHCAKFMFSPCGIVKLKPILGQYNCQTNLWGCVLTSQTTIKPRLKNPEKLAASLHMLPAVVYTGSITVEINETL